MMVPSALLVLDHSDIGLHRDRRWGFREVFGYRTLRGLPFLTLAGKVKAAYDGKKIPSHAGWPAQREALRWLVDKGRDGIYALDEAGIEVRVSPFQRYYITDGNHRALALYVLGEREIRARVSRGPHASSSSRAADVTVSPRRRIRRPGT